jgi:hypothetical protein
MARAQEAEELNSLAQAPLHHLRADNHLGQDGGDLGRPEIKLAVEILDGVEDLGMAQMRVAQRRDLRPFPGEKVDFLIV